MENTSGGGSTAVVPSEVNRWNWGAFLLTWIWGIGNNTFIAFLMFVPFVNIVMWFILGAKGSAWAWQNKRWDSVVGRHCSGDLRAAVRRHLLVGHVGHEELGCLPACRQRTAGQH